VALVPRSSVSLVLGFRVRVVVSLVWLVSSSFVGLSVAIS